MSKIFGWVEHQSQRIISTPHGPIAIHKDDKVTIIIARSWAVAGEYLQTIDPKREGDG